MQKVPLSGRRLQLKGGKTLFVLISLLYIFLQLKDNLQFVYIILTPIYAFYRLWHTYGTPCIQTQTKHYCKVTFEQMIH